MFNNNKIALGIEYSGSNYSGWQRQKDASSVQGCLENALSKVADHPVTVFCAGRTDAGVHATGQIVHFTTHSMRPEHAWTMGVNANLPQDIAVRWVKPVPEKFHARFSALARCYRYIIFNHCYRSAILAGGISHYHLPLDEKKMARAAQHLLGEHDFTSFRALQCQSKTPLRNVQQINISRYGAYIVVEIKANAFLHHMVRNIVGSLIEIGCGRQNEDWLKQLLALKDRKQAAATAKAEGLYLVAVDYPACFALPQTSLGSYFLPDIPFAFEAAELLAAEGNFKDEGYN
ncbi:tRNA pseudouridine(38-40) synthase TruA [Candidatus Regiella insecticola]|uniref:tRNA pseudouridine synthase A n=1 Tax=Candidatus Regiella insecticola TaxID=138073 RepID=A0A6L2ZLY7_9ENTR|nr:tRNA pseudouridine(38-40) synthase TruA [Candidatus Regiella insecticola]GFN45592.1 tRNA pseudouridine synthase A [Candidatus Regiella insecticola]